MNEAQVAVGAMVAVCACMGVVPAVSPELRIVLMHLVLVAVCERDVDAAAEAHAGVCAW